jgi:modulator of FtsH protease
METLSQTADPHLAPPRPAANDPTAAATTPATRVLRNTYALLAMTLLFSGGVAAASVALALPAPGMLIALGGSLGLLYVVHKVRDSAWALPAVFAFTGFMGYTLGPLLTKTLAMAGGGQIVAMALGATGITFLALSAWVLTTRRDFSFLGGFLFAGMVIAIIAAVAAVLMQWPTLALVVSAMVALLSAGLILYETSRIVNGGETNYVLATVGLYVSIFNLFSSLLGLFGLGGAQE